jgi:hypothetical protein
MLNWENAYWKLRVYCWPGVRPPIAWETGAPA